MSALDKLRANASAALVAYRELESRIDAEKREARYRVEREISERYSDEWNQVYAAKRDAERALHDYTVSTAAHPFEGKRIKRKVNRPIYRGSYRTAPADEFGIVEVRRDDTEFAENIGGWRKPDYGRAFIRLCKKDGKPGVAIWRGFVPTDRLPDEWELAEPEGVDG